MEHRGCYVVMFTWLMDAYVKFLLQVVDDHMALGFVHCVDPWPDWLQGPQGRLLVSNSCISLL